MRALVGAKRQLPFKLLLVAVILAGPVTGCTYRGWYEGFKQSAQRECLKNREDCADSTTYEEYRRERDRQLEKD